eukprot:g16515.t1
MRVTSMTPIVLAFAAVASVAAETERFLSAENPNNCRVKRNTHRGKASPDLKANPRAKMIVFGDSNSDVGRRFSADSSYDFPLIGPFPWEKLYDSSNPDTKIPIYSTGSATNGRVWPEILDIPKSQNFATSSASASALFRSTQNCKGYTKSGDEATGTFEEQINEYFNTKLSDETKEYAHVVILGGNDIKNGAEAFRRQRIADGIRANVNPAFEYDEPVAGIDSTAEITEFIETAIVSLVTDLTDGIFTLLSAGVTGKILVANLPSPKNVPAFIQTGFAATLDGAVLQANAQLAEALKQLSDSFGVVDQVRVLDLYRLTAALSDEPEIFTSRGFGADLLTVPCMVPDFSVDQAAEVMGTQNFRQGGQGLAEGSCGDNVCALCETDDSPCPKCWLGNPTATICKCPNDHVFFDDNHTTAAFNSLFARATYQCSLEAPNMSMAFVPQLCG